MQRYRSLARALSRAANAECLIRGRAFHAGAVVDGAQASARSTPALYSLAAIGGSAALGYGLFSSAAVSHAEAQQPPAAASTSSGGAEGKQEASTGEAGSSNPYAIPAPGRGLPREIVLYQYEVCPFCCKVKAFLDYYKVPYRVVEVNPLTKAELKWSQYKKVPVVVLDGEQVNDSSAIISRLAAELGAGAAPARQAPGSGWFGLGSGRKGEAGGAADGPASAEEEERWRRWVDERFVRVVTVNIYRSARESFQTFDYIAEHGNFGAVQAQAARVVGATMMWGLSKRLRKKYGVEGDVRAALYADANKWAAAVGEGRPFMGGDRPGLADLAVFGVMRSVVGTDTFHDMLHSTRVSPWYERMMAAVGDPARLTGGA